MLANRKLFVYVYIFYLPKHKIDRKAAKVDFRTIKSLYNFAQIFLSEFYIMVINNNCFCKLTQDFELGPFHMLSWFKMWWYYVKISSS